MGKSFKPPGTKFIAYNGKIGEVVEAKNGRKMKIDGKKNKLSYSEVYVKEWYEQ